MSRPVNPYARAQGFDASDAPARARDESASFFSVPERVPQPAGLSGVDLNEIAVRNYRLGRSQARESWATERAELIGSVAQAWDEGQAAGLAYGDERAQVQVEAILRLVAAKLEPQKGVSDAQSRRAATELVRGAVVVLADAELVSEDREGAPDGLTVRGFEALERVLLSAAREQDEDDIGSEG